ncbi:glycerate kinase [Cronobacter malonaticus]|uniref:glycerate kinase n=1 Tax=Cronobacter malonaticus TaxID=413503 RepID=UPI000CFBE438|nr:glycerate kinase [Cronobacter malonaticus]ELY2621913.1 glycerate kinase [Cronobacter malonaticus]ELY3624334.1 glycerate kinase [Cronobacter malonaticus]ELY4125828.1 glycerate kinase [Cronobacter malonaticus]MDI6461375.1 glycerate kinase [Cronobacter malonaticus]MDT3534833.1 glycerate kinase [Cronobacter malonaticus]
MTTLKKIVIAPDSFKESLSAMDVAKAIEAGFREIYPQAHYVCVPMADGGEGTVEAMVAATGGQIITTPVTAPLGNKVDGFFGLLGDGETAVVEMAAASGLHLVPAAQRDPRITTSYGTGELILAALERGVKAIIIGIGGSATNDGGAGMMQALGARFLDGEGRELAPGGAALARLARLDLSALDPRLAQVSVTVACDVDNPLCGEKGASAVFGPQKGATPAMVTELDAALRCFGEQLEAVTGKTIISAPGAGAAGGMGAALLGMLNAELRPGIEIVIESLGLAQAVRDADLVITGEGRLDSQSIHGKTPIGVARVAKQFQRPVVAIAGSLTPDYQIVHEHGIDAAFSVIDRIVTLQEALDDAERNLRVTARNVAALWRLAENRH